VAVTLVVSGCTPSEPPITLALPRIRDFRGRHAPKLHGGNYTLGCRNRSSSEIPPTTRSTANPRYDITIVDQCPRNTKRAGPSSQDGNAVRQQLEPARTHHGQPTPDFRHATRYSNERVRRDQCHQSSGSRLSHSIAKCCRKEGSSLRISRKAKRFSASRPRTQVQRQAIAADDPLRAALFSKARSCAITRTPSQLPSAGVLCVADHLHPFPGCDERPDAVSSVAVKACTSTC